MTFLYPMMLWALALPLLLAVVALLRYRHAGRGWQQLVSPAHAAQLVVKTPAWRSILPSALALLALVGGILAAARPINGYTTTEAMATGRNLLIALDISRSMETQDVKPSRLEEARAAAFELVDALPGDKIGLIVFSGEADLVVPLTYDHTALRDALEQVNRNWAGYGGTNFGLVLKKAMQDFSRSAPTGTNALVIFSDGEDTVGSSLDIAKEAREQHLLVITVGVGTSIGESIPDARGENGLYQDAAGKHVISKLDTAALQRFSEATGGSYFTMGSGADLTAFAREAVKKLDTHEESFSGHKVPRDLFAPFALTSLLLLVVSVILSTEWRASRGGALPLLFLLLMLAVPPLSAAPEEQAIRAYEEALGHMEADADKAREGFSRALLDKDARIQAASLYQLGNMNARATFNKLRSLYGQEEAATREDEADEASADLAAPMAAGQPTPEQLQDIVDELGKGLQPYRDALTIRPGMQAAQTNIRNIEAFMEKLREEIERLKQQQNPQDQQDERDEQNDQQDQQQNQQGGGNDQQQDNPKDDQNDKEQQGDQQQDGDQQNQPRQQPEDKQGDQQQNNTPQHPEDEQGDQPQDKPRDQQGKDNMQEEQPQPQQPRQARRQQAQERPMSDQEKAEQRAASILRMHVDEEKGSPIPHMNDAVRPPEKDY